MKKYLFEGKNLEDATNKALNELNVTEDNLIVKIIESKQGILKKIVKIEVIDINDVINYLKETIKEITSLMNIDNVNLEVRRRENNINITIILYQ